MQVLPGASGFMEGIVKRLGLSGTSDSLVLEMVPIRSGTFFMGSLEDEPERDDGEGPYHSVTVSPFLMGRYPVTQEQWHAVAKLPQIDRELNANPSHFSGDSHPVEQVSWHDAVEFCARLSLHTGLLYRLPSEEEWEYACRAGTETPFHVGDIITTNVANYNGSSYADGPKGERRGETTPVNHFDIANAFGLSDMHGNVFEWCADHWHDNYDGAPTDGSAWLEGSDSSLRVRRGGCWKANSANCRSASRGFNRSVDRGDHIGFRVVCEVPKEA
jgi:formylglycine-generating enzyme required for sulfatase activity